MASNFSLSSSYFCVPVTSSISLFVFPCSVKAGTQTVTLKVQLELTELTQKVFLL